MAKKYKCRLEYLESTGTQWIDTGVYSTQLTEVEYICAVTGSVVNADSHLFGSRLSASSEAFDLAYMNTGSNGTEKFRFIHGTTTTQETATSVTASQLANPHTYYMSGTSFKVDGLEKMSFTTASFTGSYSLWLFGVNNAGSLHNQVRAQKVYKCVIWNNGTPVRDFIPVLDLSGKPAMYDQVSGKLFYNQGTGEFTYGRQIIPVEYLESTETQYIDTGFALTANSTLDFTFSPNEQSGLNFWVCGAYTTNTKLTGFRISSSTSLQGYIDNTSSIDVSGNNIGKKYHCVMNSTNWSVNGIDGTSATQVASRCNLTIFGWNASPNTSSVSVSGKCSVKLYDFKILDNGTLVRDFIPCIDENHVPFMFDKVNNTVYLNAGTGQFKVGPNIEKIWGGKKLRKKLALMLATLKKKRKYYCEVEYLEGTGTQYIDTGIIPSETVSYSWEIYAQAVDTGVNDYHWFIGTQTPWAMAGTYPDTSSDYTFYPGGGDYYQDGVRVSTPSGGNKYAFVKHIISYTGSSSNSTSITLFARRSSNGGVSAAGSKKIFGCKISKNNVLVRDFIPVLGWDGKGYMYDKVSGQLFKNAGTGDFVAGRQIHPVEYLESTGSQYIDTGVQYIQGDTIELNGRFVNPEHDDGLVVMIPWNTPSNSRFMFAIADSGNISSFTMSYNSLPGGSNNPQPRYLDDKFHTWHYEGLTLTIDDGLVSLTNTENYNQGSGTLRLFYRFNGACATAIKYYKQWRDNTLIRDFVPMVDELGVGAMFDQVTHTIYDNAGTGAFSYNPVEIEYLESDGTQYIDTGIKYDINKTYQIENKIVYTTTQAQSQGNGWDAGGQNSISTAGDILVGDIIIAKNVIGKVVELTQTINSGSGTLSVYNYMVDGISLPEASRSHTSLSQYAGDGGYGIFAMYSTSFYSYFCKAKCYKYKILENNVLVRDFIPVYYNGVAGMWDKVNSVFYSNAGTNAFVVGAVKEPEYE